ncbi:LamG domain-containing protein [Candidatus Woesearchaeota archaeon]|nr:LamG domain-containing protein [Candidatus Woesearchaeota archaeon]MCF7900743.1 LamG domain-containing protein [Candidatus Woesearchaeota archaeon]MCF8012908.1 LamG domain-containing protein [Candidatus Woesearchaeota archaeon]
MNKYIIFFLIFFLLVISFQNSLADITCNLQSTASCTDDILLTLQSDTGGINNSHVNYVNQTQYANSMCCSSTTQNIGTECNEKADSMLYLYALTNSHIQDPEDDSLNPRYTYSTCVNSLGTSYCTLSESSCPASYECMGSMANSEGNNNTNAHLGDCNAYNLKICCFLNSIPTQDIPILNSSTGINNTNDDLNIYYQNENDADSHSINWSYDWRKTDTKREVLNMHFDQKVNTTTTDAVKDYSTYLNHGTLGGGTGSKTPNWTTNGKIGGAYEFDGVDDYIEINNDSELDFSTGNMTISLWIKINTQYSGGKGSNENVSVIIDKGTGRLVDGYGIQHDGSSQKLRFSIDKNDASSVRSDLYTDQIINYGEWYFVVAKIEKGTKYFYINGEQETTTGSVGGEISEPSRNLIIGKHDVDGGGYFNGTIDEPRIYNYALTAEQITAEYYAGLRRYRNNYDGESIALLNMNFNSNVSNESTAGIKDYSTSGIYGTLGGGTASYVPTWTSEGAVGGAYAFDGVNDKIEVPQHIIDQLNGSQTFIIWYKQHPDAVSIYQTVLGGASWSGSINKGHAIGFSTSLNVGSDIYSGDPYGNHRSTLTYSMPADNNWHFVASAYNAETNTHYLRLDGSSKTKTPDFLTHNIDWSGSGLAIGKKGDSNSYWFNGSFDEVMIFDRYLSNEEILQIYNEGYNKLVSQETTSGDNWSVAVTPSDGYDDGITLLSNSLLIGNTAPDMSDVRISPNTSVYTNNSLAGYCTGTDDDGGSITFNYIWYRNETLYDSGISSSTPESIELNVDTITSGETTKLETWILSCSANDGTQNSSWMNSTTLTIINAPPSTVNLSKPDNGDLTYTNRTPYYNWTNATDIDSDSITYQILVSRYVEFNDTARNSTGITNNYYAEPNDQDFDTYFWKIRANDGTEYGEWSETWNYTIASSVIITTINNQMNFGTLLPQGVNDTTNDSPEPFQFRNDGNIEADLRNTTAQESIWLTETLGTAYWTLQPRSTGTFNEAQSVMSSSNISSSLENIVKGLDWHTSNNTITIDIGILVPTYETPGEKSSTINMSWGAAS